MNITQTLTRATQINRNGTALIFGEREWTYTQLHKRVAKLAGALQNLGIEENDRVAVLALASDRFVELLYGVAWAGGIVVPLNFRLSVAELTYMLNDSGARILIVDDTFVEMLRDFEGQLETVENFIFIGDGETPDGTLNYETLLDDAKAIEDVGRDGDDILGIFYTGGTTGLPKGVMTTQQNAINEAIVANPKAYIKDAPLIALCATPLFHVTGTVVVYGTIAEAGQLVIMPRFDPVEAMRLIQVTKATMTIWVPTMINMIVNHPAVGDFDISSMQNVTYGGSPMPVTVAKKAMEVMPQTNFIHVFGMTEVSGYITRLEPEFHVIGGENSRIQSAGWPLMNSEMKIVSINDEEVPRGTLGEIVMRGGLVMKGYWNKPEKTAETLRGGWLHSGDVGYMDDDGFIYLVDRIKDMIITGGENVYSVEVENVIYKHPAVKLCAVIGIPSDEWGEAIHAIVTLKNGCKTTEEEIITHCREQIAHYKCPSSVTISSDPLPLSGAGKVLKHILRKPYWVGFEKPVN